MSSFLQAWGLWLDEEDLLEARWDLRGGSPRLWLSRSPASVRRGGSGPARSAVLAAFLERLFGGRRGVERPEARAILDRLLEPGAACRRAEFWLSSALRTFPELASPEAAQARARTLGSAGGHLRSAATRALIAQGRALLTSRTVRVFAAQESALSAGGALGLEESPATAAQAIRALRERHAREAEGRRALWIAVEPDRWDELSRRAFETASRALRGEVETEIVAATTAPPLLPDEWRREIFVPCGTLNASLKFYERFAALAQANASGARSLAEEILRSPGWAAYASDPTGDGAVPAPPAPPDSASSPVVRSRLESELLEAISVIGGPVETQRLAPLFPPRDLRRGLSLLEERGDIERAAAGAWRLPQDGCGGAHLPQSRRREICLRLARSEEDPGRAIELLLAGGDSREALARARQWIDACSPGGVERWFGLSALLASAAPEPLPPWLEMLEAERELAGGRPEEAEQRLSRVLDSAGAAGEERRTAGLRLAEVAARRGRIKEAGRLAAAWRRAFPSPEAPAGESVRALVLEAGSRAREGEQEAALALLDEADRTGAGLATPARLEAALARAAAYSLAGRFREEREVYERWRPLVLGAGDDLLTARFLSHEALGLADRREFAQAIARLEEALAAARDDPAERARLSIDLASTLYHAGRPERSRELLDEAAAIAGSIGRQDLARIARSNRLELMINRREWAAASEEIESLAALARAEGDETRLLVALHHRSRLALRRGLLAEAARDNAQARALAGKLSDRLEIGELWLEEGDRLVYEGDLAAARRAYEAAAEDPPDRCDSGTKARQRLAELDRAGGDGLRASAVDTLAGLFESDEYEAAETAARWQILLRGRSQELPADLSSRARRILRSSGGAALADRAFGNADPSESPGCLSDEPALRRLRGAVAGALAGESVEAPLGDLGLAGLRLADAGGRELACFGRIGEDAARRTLEAGSASYELSLSPPSGPGASSVALLLETLLFRLPPAAPPSDFAEGWRRLGVIAADASMEEPYRRLLRFGPQPVTVLVLGESGCGKEAVARAVHALSPRASAPFVAVNVPAIPPALLESELFGHARGAFTGADRDRKGLLEEAERGTIFFDEVGDLTLPLQAKLLRALQEREIRRVGENRPRRLDVRVVSATSRNLQREVEAGRFREDLYYRLHVAVIALPPLRERGGDVPLLARHFLSHYAREYGRANVAFAPETLASLCGHSWPGNVRELQNVVAQAAALAESGGVILPALLPETLRRPKLPVESRKTYRTRVDEHRRSLIADALERSGGNRSRAARDLGLSRQALLYLIRELNVNSRPRSGH